MCSDYDGTRSTVDAANGGLDIAMPGPPARPDYFGGMLAAAVTSGAVTEAVVSDKATRVVYSLAAVGLLDKPNPNSGHSSNDVTSAAHVALARRLAAESVILLKVRRRGTGRLPGSCLSVLSVDAALLVGWQGKGPPKT